MKQIAFLLLFSAAFCHAEEVTLTRSAVVKSERSIVALKPGTVVELLGRDDKLLKIRYGKISGTIPAASIAAPVANETAKKEVPAPNAEAPSRKATTNYGKAVEKAKENAAKRDKNVVKPLDEILP